MAKLVVSLTGYCPSVTYFAPSHVQFITGSIARSATRRYLLYSEAEFEVFCPAGATTRCTDWVKFGT